MKEEPVPEVYIPTEEPEQAQKFARLRRSVGALASGAYMLTFGPNALRVWGGVAGASLAFFGLTPSQDFEVAGLELEVSPDLPTHNFNGSILDLNGLGRIEYPTHIGPAAIIKPSNEQDTDRIKAGIDDLRNSSDLSSIEETTKDALLKLGLTGTLVGFGGTAGASLIDILLKQG